jgi:hypothetical protein
LSTETFLYISDLEISLATIRNLVYRMQEAHRRPPMEQELDDDTENRRGRSPSFPFISIRKAIERIETLAKNHGKSPARPSTIATTWGYAQSSSGLQQTISALKQYGLIEDAGRGADRKIQLTELGWRIVKDKRPGALETAIDEAIRKPNLMAAYLPLWVPDRPSDIHCISELQLDRGFTEASAKAFIKVFDENVSENNLAKTDAVVDSSEDGQFPNPVIAQPTRMAPVIMASVGGRPSFAPTNRATLPLPEGTVALELPEGLSKESQEILKSWFELMLRLKGSSPEAQDAA